MDANPSIAICIITYKRPDELKNLLKTIASLHFSDINPEIKIVVVDNSVEREAAPVVQSAQAEMPWKVIYDVEESKGLCAARNHAVRLASNVDLIAFVDDDEIVYPDWMNELLTALYKYDADIVRGPVISMFKSEPPRWIKQGNYYQRPMYEDGQRLTNANTGNVLVKTSWLNKISPPFDMHFNRLGAEDSFLFRQLHQQGAKIVWAKNAIVEEILPEERLTAKWLLARSFRLGDSAAIVAKRLGKGFFPLLFLTMKNVIKIVLGIVLLPFVIFLGKGKVVRLLRYICYGLGYILGIFGYQHLTY